MQKSLALRIAGAAGDGIESAGEMVIKLFSRNGLHVFAFRGYQSVIRGGHVWYQIRISNEKLMHFGDMFDILITLNKDGITEDIPWLKEGGIVIYDPKKFEIRENEKVKKFLEYKIPLQEIARKFSTLSVIQNVVAIGAFTYLVNLPIEALENQIRETFSDKSREVIDMNLNAARAGYEYAKNNFAQLAISFDYSKKKRLTMAGNYALAFGAYRAGCKFYAAYPMTPASSILHWFAEHAPKTKMIVVQPEDEIAVINMTIGAALAGVRAMCGTSGGGFALMTEAIGLAAMTETPIVVVESQRGGPSTGLPTKTEQADVFQALGAGQGDFPKVIIAPTSVKDCYYTAIEAFNIAERYQVPVIILLDLYLSERVETLDPDEINLDVKIDRGWIVKEGEIKDYKRYMITENGVSPRALPGTPGYMHVAASDEHDEKGHLISDVLAGLPSMLKIRRAMMEKRMRKLEYIIKELPAPKIYGEEDADLTIVSWGSTCYTVREAIEMLKEEGITANALELKYLYPMHAKEISEVLNRAKKTMIVESNYTSQVGRLIRMFTGINIENKVLRYDGEPITPLDVFEKAIEVVKK